MKQEEEPSQVAGFPIASSLDAGKWVDTTLAKFKADSAAVRN